MTPSTDPWLYFVKLFERKAGSLNLQPTYNLSCSVKGPEPAGRLGQVNLNLLHYPDAPGESEFGGVELFFYQILFTHFQVPYILVDVWSGELNKGRQRGGLNNGSQWGRTRNIK